MRDHIVVVVRSEERTPRQSGATTANPSMLRPPVVATVPPRRDRRVRSEKRTAGRWPRPARSLLFLCALGGLALGCSRQATPPPTPTGERVVSLTPSLTEIVCAVGAGDRLVGRTSACDFPPALVTAVPIVGGFGAPSLDGLVRVKPTLVLESDLADETVGALIAQLGVKRLRVKCVRLDDIPPAIRTVGERLERGATAHTLAESIAAHVTALRAAADAREKSGASAPSVYVEIWCDPLMTAGRASFVAELVRLAGGRNLGDEAEKEYYTVSPEWIVARDPDVVVCLYPTSADGIRNQVGQRLGWAQLKAVKENRVYGGLDNNVILRPGPRVLEGIEVLRRCVEKMPP